MSKRVALGEKSSSWWSNSPGCVRSRLAAARHFPSQRCRIFCRNPACPGDASIRMGPVRCSLRVIFTVCGRERGGSYSATVFQSTMPSVQK